MLDLSVLKGISRDSLFTKFCKVLRILQENTIENIGNLKFGQINIRLDARSTHKIYLTFVVVFCHFEVVFAWPIGDPNQTFTPMPHSVEFVWSYDIYRRLFS